MSAVNYGYNENLGHYVFLAPGEEPKANWLGSEWVWWHPPEPWVRMIGETGLQGCVRSKHATRTCPQCRTQLRGDYKHRRVAPLSAQEP